MKRFLVLQLIFFIFLSIANVNALTCYDSDGLDYYTKGYVKFDDTTYYDNCVNEKVLIEGYCEDDYFKTMTYYCPSGCENGACVLSITATTEVKSLGLPLSSIAPEIKYSTADIQFEKKCFDLECYDRVKIKNYGYIHKPGEPILPMKNIILAIPYNAEVTSVNLTSKKEIVLPGTYDIQPCPPIQYYIGYTNVSIKPQKNMTIYGKNQFYPSDNYELQGTYFFRGYKIVVIKFYPLRYNPVTKRLKKIVDINIKVNYVERGQRIEIKKERDYLLEDIIINYDEALSNGWGKATIEMTAPSSASLPSGSYDYVLITNDTLAPYAQPLVDWRNAHGIRSTLVKTSYIYSNYGGSSDAERIRNFIIDAYNNWGIKYVTLGGDVDVIPSVIVWPSVYFFYEYPTYSDYYYAGLDGNWDYNGNGVLGELYDGIDEADWFPEVYVGRLPVSNSSEMEIVVNKIINYESGLHERPDNMLMLAAKGNDEDDCAETKEAIITFAVPDNYSVTRLYESLGNLSVENTIHELNRGYEFANYANHGDTDSLQYAISTTDIPSLTNIDRLPFFYAMACLSGCFLKHYYLLGIEYRDVNYDCLGEQLVTAENGGVVGYIGSTNLAPYIPGDMHALSNGLDELFWFEFFGGFWSGAPPLIPPITGGGYFKPGDALYIAKLNYSIHNDMSDESNRVVLLEFNLLGDPVINVCFSGSPECHKRVPNSIWCDGNVRKYCDSSCNYVEEVCRLDAEDSDGGSMFKQGTCTDYLGCANSECQEVKHVDVCVKDMFPDCREEPFYCPSGDCETLSGWCFHDVPCAMFQLKCDPNGDGTAEPDECASYYGEGWGCAFDLTHGCYCGKKASIRPGYEEYLKEYYVSGTGDSASCRYVYKNCKDFGPYYFCSEGRCRSSTGSCPILKVFNGKEFKEIEKLNIHSEEGVDTVYSTSFRMKPFKENTYKIILEEKWYALWEGSHIDLVKLIDSEGKECKLIKAIHSKLGDVTSLIKESDDERVETKPGERIELTYTGCGGEEFRLSIEGYNPWSGSTKVLLSTTNIVILGIIITIIVLVFIFSIFKFLTGKKR